MAIFHLSVKIIKRADGRSVVAAAAYRSATKMKSEYDGLSYDYTRKGSVVHSNILLPENAPARFSDRNTLWNEVELAEKSANAQLARELEIALPTELTEEEYIKLVEEYIEKNITSRGMIADYSIHNPVLRDDLKQPIDDDGNVITDPEKYIRRNPHVHILLTMRPMTSDGTWQSKYEIEYICKKNGEEKAMTGQEYNMNKNDGWEKQYQYFEGKKKVWHTPSEAEELSLKRVKKTARTSMTGRPNPIIADWNSPQRVTEWRQSWEYMTNGYLARNGCTSRISCKSYAAQGIDHIPSIHLGPQSAAIEKRARRLELEGKKAEHSDRFLINRYIRDYNHYYDGLRMLLDTFVNVISEIIERIARILEKLRLFIASDLYEQQIIEAERKEIEIRLKQEKERVSSYVRARDMLESLSSPDLIEYYKKTAEKFYETKDLYHGAVEHIKDREEALEQAEHTAKYLKSRIENILKQYAENKAEITMDKITELKAAQQKIRQEMEITAENYMRDKLKGNFNEERFKKALQNADELIMGGGHARNISMVNRQHIYR